MISTIFGTIGSFFGGLFGALRKWVDVFLAYRVGKRAARAEAQDKVSEIQDEQLEIASGPKRRRDELLGRMRERDRSS